MKVIIDISPLKSAHKTRGIGMYTRRLVDAVREIDKDNKYILTTKSDHISDADIIHYPYFDLFFHTLPLKKQTKTVVTIHDLIPLMFPKDFPSGIKGKIRFFLQRTALKNVNTIITDSQNSKKDIIKYLNINENKISVVYLAAAKEFTPKSEKEILEIRKKYNLPEKFVLYVGDVNANKNLIQLIEAFCEVNNSHPKLHLVLVGRAFKNHKLVQVKEIKEKIVNSKLEDKVHIISNVPLDPSKDLVAIYNAASVYVQPSLYEGFGLPILEAFACGTPVVASNVSSIPEITGDAAILVNPNSIPQIASGIKKAITLSETNRNKLIEKGMLQAKKFSWKKTALETIAIYKKIIEN